MTGYEPIDFCFQNGVTRQLITGKAKTAPLPEISRIKKTKDDLELQLALLSLMDKMLS